MKISYLYKIIGFIVIQVVIVGTLFLLIWPQWVTAQEPYEGYYNYLGNYPIEHEGDWTHEAQGITHDDDFWYITQDWFLWKIPVTQDLASVSFDTPGVFTVCISPFCEHPLVDAGYDHFGDMTEYNGYLVIGTTGEGKPDVVAVFRTYDFSYVGSAVVDSGSWVAVNPADGHIWTNHTCNSLAEYKLNWDELKNDPPSVEFQGSHTLYHENGINKPCIEHKQGAVFTESGDLIYISSGFPGDPIPYQGINVFDTNTWTRVAYSSNGVRPFNFEFDPTSPISHEPEGITIWDLDKDTRAPNISGQLHVILLDNDLSWDDVYLKHYTEKIYVSWVPMPWPGEGTPFLPFNTVTEANNISWNGSQIKIVAGSYPESLIFNKRMRVSPVGEGSAIIGQ